MRKLLSLLVASIAVMSAIIIAFNSVGEPTSPPPAASPTPASPAAHETPAGYVQLTPDAASARLGELALVNNGHPLDDITDRDMVSVYDGKTSSYFVGGTGILVHQDMLPQLNAMLDAFYAASGRKIVNVISGYRTYDDQQRLYDASLQENGAEHTARYYALPGRSEHHSGLAVDFALFNESDGSSAEFDGSGDCAWFGENAWQYGFVLRYAADKESVTGIAYESWHYRYVGVPHARLMRELDMCLEEYLQYLSGFTFDGEHLTAEADGARYEIYKCQSDSLYVPENGSYSVSGDGCDGFIVTVRL